MELDATDPTIWLKLESCVEEYIEKNRQAFLGNACERLLLPSQHDRKWLENLRSKSSLTNESNEGNSSPTLGWRRNVLLVEASHSPDSGSVINHARVLESFCARNGIRFSLMRGLSV
ncbi:hypothetical protein HN51_063978 [Arachis hypogaea]